MFNRRPAFTAEALQLWFIGLKTEGGRKGNVCIGINLWNAMEARPGLIPQTPPLKRCKLTAGQRFELGEPCMVVWLCGCGCAVVVVQLYDCAAVRLCCCGCAVMQLRGCVVAVVWLHGCDWMIVWLCGYVVVLLWLCGAVSWLWLCDCAVMRLCVSLRRSKAFHRFP